MRRVFIFYQSHSKQVASNLQLENNQFNLKRSHPAEERDIFSAVAAWRATGSSSSGGGGTPRSRRTERRWRRATASWWRPSPPSPAAAATASSPPSPTSARRGLAACAIHLPVVQIAHLQTTRSHGRRCYIARGLGRPQAPGPLGTLVTRAVRTQCGIRGPI